MAYQTYSSPYSGYGSTVQSGSLADGLLNLIQSFSNLLTVSASGAYQAASNPPSINVYVERNGTDEMKPTLQTKPLETQPTVPTSSTTTEQRANPVHNEMDELDYHSTSQHEGYGSQTYEVMPFARLPMESSDTQYLFRVLLPGVGRENIRVRLLNDKLVISNRNCNTSRVDSLCLLEFNYSYRVPEDANCDQMSVTYINGVLAVTVARMHEERELEIL